MHGEHEPFELEARAWLKERSIDEALAEGEITEEDVLMVLLQLGYITLPPWLEDYPTDGLR